MRWIADPARNASRIRRKGSYMSFQKSERVVNEEVLAAVRQENCIVCFYPPPSDPSHIKSVGSGGPDAFYNVFPMCRRCHTKWHAEGWKRFLTRHYGFWTILQKEGWRREGGKLLNEKIKENASYNLPKKVDV